MSGGCPRVGNFSDQKWGISVIAVTQPGTHRELAHGVQQEPPTLRTLVHEVQATLA